MGPKINVVAKKLARNKRHGNYENSNKGTSSKTIRMEGVISRIFHLVYFLNFCFTLVFLVLNSSLFLVL